MILWQHFHNLVINVLKRQLDPAQQNAISANVTESLFIVAGPGSGKTTVLALRVLKLIFVDGVDPAEILATTFTRKAAAELRSRILGWGDQLRQALLNNPASSAQLQNQLQRLGFNRVITGTLDSIAEQTLADFRTPRTQPPILLEEFVAKTIMQRHGLWNGRRDQNRDFQEYVRVLSGNTRRPNRKPNQKEMLDICYEVRNRFAHDRINVVAFQNKTKTQHPGAAVLCQVIHDYISRLKRDLVMDFAALEEEFLKRLRNRSLSRFVEGLRVVLVDEYQDTNLLQERIYFTLARNVNKRGGSITVVGDDDQSLYRFRGATVELFTAFRERLEKQCGIQAKLIYLSNNYRSTNTIVRWCNDFIRLDSGYTQVRMRNKPSLTAARVGSYVDYPILGMFRPDVATLARDLAQFIYNVFKGNGITITIGNQQLQIVKNPNGGDVGDGVLLCSSPREYSAGGDERLPLLIRKELESLGTNIKVFNPRGQEFGEIEAVQQLCGLILECIDPKAQIQDKIEKLPDNIAEVFNRWRKVAWQYIASNPSAPGSTNPPAPGSTNINTLQAFVLAWQQRKPQGSGSWPREVPLIELVYKLITWIPTFREDPEGLIYLEAITRTISQSARFTRYDATIQRDQPHADSSVREILWRIFEPLASGAIDIDEELIEAFPRDRLNIMSIHQAKGLEFPLVIVDVGSDFTSHSSSQAFIRFPTGGSRPHNLEDALRPFSRSPRLRRLNRPAIDRAFDDLIRQYFVAFSRPQDILMLVGLSDNNGKPKNIRNVATGWTRDGKPQWSKLSPSIVYL